MIRRTPQNLDPAHGNDDVIKWKHFPRYWPFVGGIRRSPVNSPHKGQWRGALIFSLICAWKKNKHWVNTREAGDFLILSHQYHILPLFTFLISFSIIALQWCHCNAMIEHEIRKVNSGRIWYWCDRIRKAINERMSYWYDNLIWPISPRTRWLPLRRRYFQMNFRESYLCILIKVSLNFVLTCHNR